MFDLPRRGFTLLETLISLVILTTGLLAVCVLFLHSARASFRNKQRTVATLLLQEKLEDLRATPVRDPDWAPGVHADQPGGYYRTWQVTGTGIRIVTIVVHAMTNEGTSPPLELARATTMAAP